MRFPNWFLLAGWLVTGSVLLWVALYKRHHYYSTACYHEVHSNCRKICKFCFANCGCECHS